MELTGIHNHTGNLTNGKKMQIAATPQAFTALAKTLYKDPVTATIRELAANAYDAHIQNGNPNVPFKVTLPTEYVSEFRIRDYGTGISHEKINSLYSTYFDSDKTATNDLTGAYGLGSKTPFAITDTYTIITREESEPYARHYLAYKDNGIPSIKYIGTMENFQRGTMITFTTSGTSWYKWHHEASWYLSFYPTIPEHNLQKQITSWYEGARKDGRGNYYKLSSDVKPYIIMGNIPYQLPYTTKHMDINFTVPIGTFQPAISRDALHLNEDEREKLKQLGQHYARLLYNNERLQIACTKNLEQLENLNLSIFSTFTPQHFDIVKKKHPLYTKGSRFYLTRNGMGINAVQKKNRQFFIEFRSARSNTYTSTQMTELYLNSTAKIFYGPENLRKTFSRNIKYYIEEGHLRNRIVYYVPSERFEYLAEWIHDHWYNLGEPERFTEENYPYIRKRKEKSSTPAKTLRGWSVDFTEKTRHELLELLGTEPDRYVWYGTKLKFTIGQNFFDLTDTYKPVRLVNRQEMNTREYSRIDEILTRNSEQANRRWEQELEKLRMDRSLQKEAIDQYRMIHCPYWLRLAASYLDLDSWIGPMLDIKKPQSEKNQLETYLTLEQKKRIIHSMDKVRERFEVKVPLLKAFFTTYAFTVSERENSIKHVKKYVDIFLRKEVKDSEQTGIETQLSQGDQQ